MIGQSINGKHLVACGAACGLLGWGVVQPLLLWPFLIGAIVLALVAGAVVYRVLAGQLQYAGIGWSPPSASRRLPPLSSLRYRERCG